MQVSVEEIGRLGRRMTVVVPAEKIQTAISERMQKLAKTAKIDGFRPGKIPPNILKQRFGDAVENEVVNEAMKKAFVDALEEKQLKPAGSPNIESTDYAGAQLQFTANFEVYPEFTLVELQDVELEIEEGEVDDLAIDNVLLRLREQQATWSDAERPGQEGDKIVCDFIGKVDGEPFPGGQGKDFEFIIGQKQVLSDFESAGIGAEPGQSKTATVNFPENYFSPNLAGKVAEFSIEITKVLKPTLPEPTDEFATLFGMNDGIEQLKKEIHNRLQDELQQVIASRLKRKVVEKLLELNPIDLPTVLVDEEAQRIANAEAHGGNAHEHHEMHEHHHEITEDHRKAARDRVATGILLSAYLEKYQLSVDNERLRNKVMEISRMFAHEERALQELLKDRNRVAELRAVVMEDQAVDHLAQNAKRVVKRVTYTELSA